MIRIRTFAISVLIICGLLMSGCSSRDPTSQPVLTSPNSTIPPPDLGQIAANYPRVDNSTSAWPLQTLIACHVLEVPCVWASDLFGDTMHVYPYLTTDEDSEAVNTINMIWASGTHGAYINLIDRETDLILVARTPSEDELFAARLRGVTLDVRPVALDAFVFMVHVDNPVDMLSQEAIKDIYTGEILTWDTVAGSPQQTSSEIHTYRRNPNSGSQELMEKLVMQGAPMVESPDLLTETMMGPFHAIGGLPNREDDLGDPLGIGYTVFYYAMYIFPHEQVKLIGVDGVLPTAETIASRAYPLVTEVYVVVRDDTRPGSPAVMLRDWLFTDEGQAVVAESGYVPIR